MDTVRAFVCVALAPDARRVLARLQVIAGAAGARVGWTRSENLHVTLAFLGDLDVARVEDCRAALARAALGIRPFSLALGEAGAFPSLARPRVYWVDLAGDTGALWELQSRVARELDRARVSFDRKPFVPHVTVGRPKQPNDARLRAASEALSAAAIEPAAFAVPGVTLMRSELLARGARYTPLAEIPFGAADDPTSAPLL